MGVSPAMSSHFTAQSILVFMLAPPSLYCPNNSGSFRQQDIGLKQNDCLATQPHPIAAILAGEMPAPRRNLMRAQPVAAQTRSPVRCQNAMRGTANRVLRQIEFRREDSRDEIGALPRCGRDHHVAG